MSGGFHFLRPLWLLALPAAAALVWLVARREDVRARWQGIIAPHLLDHLVLEKSGRTRVKPVHLTAALIALGALALAGPAWRHERPPFVADQAPLVIALDLSQTMDAVDVSPTRLERAKLKVHDLLAQRAGARTAIVAYAGSAHLVLPLTDDADLLRTYVDALSTSLMPVPGRDTARAARVVGEALAHESTPGTALFMTDGIEPGAVDALRAAGKRAQLVVLGIGTAAGGPVRVGADDFLDDASGARVVATLDADALRKVAAAGGASVVTVTPDDTDVRWIERRVRSDLEARSADEVTRWRDEGWWLTIPIALLSAAWFRRGWTIRWAGIVVVGCLLAVPAPAAASGWRFADLWLTRDQQGWLAYRRGDFGEAAERFEDPVWRGVALYRAGRYGDALQSLARVPGADSDYDQGNALAHLGKLDAAVASYRRALERRPDFPQAKANQALVRSLIHRDDQNEEQQGDPTEPPDQAQIDEKGKQGKAGQIDVAAETAEMWMRGIQTTPAQLLQRKFALEAQAGNDGRGAPAQAASGARGGLAEDRAPHPDDAPGAKP